MRREGVFMKDCFVSGVLNATPVWVEENGIIRTSVISDGTEGIVWIERLEDNGCRVSLEAKNILRSSHFIPTLGVKTELAIFRSAILPLDERYIVNVHEEALLRGLAIPNIEVSCLLREKFSRERLKEMGFWWIAVMHTPVSSYENSRYTLCLDRYGDEDWLYVHGAKEYDSYDEEGGFAFEIPL